ncbi:hypothetical protein BH23GEM2_BH23GEM2_20920 [soil metagenome]
MGLKVGLKDALRGETARDKAFRELSEQARAHNEEWDSWGVRANGVLEAVEGVVTEHNRLERVRGELRAEAKRIWREHRAGAHWTERDTDPDYQAALKGIASSLSCSGRMVPFVAGVPARVVGALHLVVGTRREALKRARDADEDRAQLLADGGIRPAARLSHDGGVYLGVTDFSKDSTSGRAGARFRDETHAREAK